MDMNPEELEGFNESLKSLEATMRLHLNILKKKREEEDDTKQMNIIQPPAAIAPAYGRSISKIKRENTLNKASGPVRLDKVIVKLRVIVLKVGDIDTLRDKFTAEAFIQAKWREPALDGKIKMVNNLFVMINLLGR